MQINMLVYLKCKPVELYMCVSALFVLLEANVTVIRQLP